RIREVEGTQELKRVAEDVLPQIEKFLESPAEKRLRRARAGMITAASGLGAIVLFLLMSTIHDVGAGVLPGVGLGILALIIGLGLVINGLLLTVPRSSSFVGLLGPIEAGLSADWLLTAELSSRFPSSESSPRDSRSEEHTSE